ncbi:MAG: hypothetical protein ACR2LK_16080, partial [Solirubrobacteraceae bacterium]
MRCPRPSNTRPAVALALVAALVAAWTFAAGPAGGVDRADSLRDSIQGKRDREQALSGAITKLARLQRATEREVAILQGRVAAVQADLADAQAILAKTTDRRDRERARALRLRARLKQSRAKLAALLRERYTGAKPDALTVVLEADGFQNLLETVDFLRRIQRSDEKVLGAVRSGRREAVSHKRVLARLTDERRDAEQKVRRRRDALTGIAAGLAQRRAALARASAARTAALRGSRSSR